MVRQARLRCATSLPSRQRTTETAMPNSTPKPAATLTLLTMAAAVGLRLARVPNVSAVGALGLFAGGRLPLWLAWAPPLAVMAVADLILSAWLAYPPFNPWVYA